MTILPCAAKNQSDKNIESKSNNSKVFVYHIPDDSDSENAQPSSADDNPMQVQELPASPHPCAEWRRFDFPPRAAQRPASPALSPANVRAPCS